MEYISARDPEVWSKMQYRPIITSDTIKVVIENPDFKVIDSTNKTFKYKTRDNLLIEDNAWINSIIIGEQYQDNDLWCFDISEHISSIDDSAFQNCRTLTFIEIPDSITSIGKKAFSGCNGFNSSVEIVIPDSITSIGEKAFYACTNLRRIHLPKFITTVSEQIFYACRELHDVNIPDSVISIEQFAFFECNNLYSITIPSSVTSIGRRAFYNCTVLGTVKCYAIQPPELGSENFNVPRQHTLYVPAESVNAYKSVDAWNRAFAGNIQPLTE